MARKKQHPLQVFVGRLPETIFRYGWTVVLLVVAILTISAINAREAANVEEIKTVITPLSDGQLLVTEKELLKFLSASFTKPMDQLTLGDVDIERVESVLEKQAFVADADAFVDADLRLTIKITQRQPLLRIIAENGQNYFFDHDGIRMPLSDSHTPRTLVATGNILPWTDKLPEEPDHQLNELLELTRYLREDEFLNALVEQIDVMNNGELRLAPKVGDQVIYLGRYDRDRTPERLQRLKTFYREGLPYEGWRRYKSFDLRYERQVVAKKR